MPDLIPGMSKFEFADVSGLLRPRSIAVVGASDQARNLGGVAVGHLRKFGFPGQIWPVHPKAETVAGLPAFASLAALPEPPELAILAIGAANIPGALRDCAAAGVRNVIVWAGGFVESSTAGAALQCEVVEICRAHGIRLLGPNCLGVFDTELPLTASFASFLDEIDALLPGDISMVGQSGGLVTMAMEHARRSGFGFRYAVSTGNEAVLNTADFVAAFAEDPKTKVIGLYVEGTRDGEKLAAALGLARERGKPVVVLRGGTTVAAARAAAAHTGALAGESRIWHAVLDELGVIEVRSLEELLDVVRQVSSAPAKTRMAGNGIAVVTFGGGSGVLSSDQAAFHGLSVPPLGEATRARLAPLLPPIASTHNPVDLTPQVYTAGDWLRTLPDAFDTIAADPGVDAVLLQYGPMAMAAMEVTAITKAFMDRAPIPVVLAWGLPPAIIPPWLKEHGVNVFEEYERAIRVLGHFAASSAAIPGEPAPPPMPFDWSAHVPAPVAGTVVSEHACHRLLKSAGLSVAQGRLVASAEDAVAAGAEVGWPVAMKGMSEAVTHKFAAGLVRLGVDSPQAAEVASAELLARAGELGVELEGIYVQHMVDGEAEILVSALRDPTFGVVVSVGAGGVMTELLDDVVFHRAPVSPQVAEAMFRRLRLVEKLRSKGVGLDLGALSTFVSRFSALSASAPWRRFVLEVNPVKWSADGVVAVDGLLIIEEP